MNLTKKQKKHLLSKYKYVAYGEVRSVLIIEKNSDVYRIDQTDYTGLHPLSTEEISLLLSLSSDPEINQTVYSKEKMETAERINRYGY